MNREQLPIVMTLVKKDNKVLFVKRDMPEIENAHDKWEFPGGKIDFGEDPEKAAEREVLEETGYIVKVKRLLPHVWNNVWQHPDKQRHVILMCYEADLVGGQNNGQAHWFDIDNIKYDECIIGTKEFVEMIKNGL